MDERVQLVIDLLGQNKITEATAELKKLNAEVDDLAGSGGSGKGKIGNLGQAISRFGQDAAAGFSAPGDAMHKFNMMISGTANNLDPLLAALGVGTGLGGLLATIGYQLLPLTIKGFQAAFGAESQKDVETYTDHVDALRGQLKELEEKPVKVQADLSEIERLKAEIDATIASKKELDALTGAQSKLERESGQAFRDALSSTPGAREAVKSIEEEAARKAVEDSASVAGARGRHTDAVKRMQEAQAALESFSGSEDPTEIDREKEELAKAQRAVAEAEAEIKKATLAAEGKGRKSVTDTFKAAGSGIGEDQIKAQIDVGRMLGGHGVDIDPFARATPPAIVEQKAIEEARKAQDKAQREQEKSDLEQARIFDQRAGEVNDIVAADDKEWTDAAIKESRAQGKANRVAAEAEEKARRALESNHAKQVERLAQLIEQMLAQTGNIDEAYARAIQAMIQEQQKQAFFQAQAQRAMQNAQNLRFGAQQFPGGP